MIGKFGRLGDGLRHCPHCGETRRVSYLSSESDFSRHLATAKYGNTRGIISLLLPENQKIGIKLHKKSQIQTTKVVVNTDGTDFNKFKRPPCGKLYA